MASNQTSGATGNPNDPKKVSIIGKVPLEYNPKALNDIRDAIRDQTAAQENANNHCYAIRYHGFLFSWL